MRFSTINKLFLCAVVLLCSITLSASPGAKPLSDVVGDTATTSRQIELDEYVVTASRTPRALKDVPVITRVITSADIQRIAPQNIMDLLQSELPGLEITRTEGVANSITYQGLGANYLLILVDGERLAGETSRSNPDFNRIDIDNIERIEVVKGAMSALYGSGAVGAVINIITKRPSEGFEAQLQGHYDSEGEERARLNIGFRRPQWETVTNVLGRLKQSYMAHGIEPIRQIDGQDGTLSEETPVSMEIEGYRNLLLEQQFRYRPIDYLNIGLKGGYYAHERYNAGMVGELKHDVYRDYNAALKIDYSIPERGTLLFSYKYDCYNKYDYFRKLKQTDRNYQNGLHNLNLTFATHDLNNHELVCGIEFIGERLQTYQFEGKKHHASQLAVYIQDDWKINQTISLQGGIRGDYHSVTSDYSITPKLSAMWHSGGWNLRCGYAMGFRSPTLKELYTVWDHQGLFELIGNSSLKSEKSSNLSASAEYARGIFSGSVSVYRHTIRDKISTVWNLAQDTSYYSNVDKATLTGFDVQLQFRFSPQWRLRGGYSYVRDRQMVDGYNTSSTRPHSGNMLLEYALKIGSTRYSASLNGRYLGRVKVYGQDEATKRFYSITYTDYMLWRLSTLAAFSNGIRIQCGVNNLLNYKTKIITYNAGITRGVTFFVGLSMQLNELFE